MRVVWREDVGAVEFSGRGCGCEGEVVVAVVVDLVFGDCLGETIGKREAAEGESGRTAAVAAAVVLGLVVVGDCGLTGAGAV
jgi:hypothetical protein